MRMVTWNILHGGGRRLPEIALELLEIDADLIGLCEYRSGIGGGQLRGVLADHGWVHQHDTEAGPRRNGLLIACREPIRVRAARLARGHEGISPKIATVELARSGVSATVAHVPDARRGDRRAEARKSAAWHALLDEADRRRDENHVVLGDLNTGRHRVDEAGATFSCTALMGRLRAMGYRDAWEGSGCTGTRDVSWISHTGSGFRLDHAFCSRPLVDAVLRSTYVHGPRLRGVSDHSALVVDLRVERSNH